MNLRLLKLDKSVRGAGATMGKIYFFNFLSYQDFYSAWICPYGS